MGVRVIHKGKLESLELNEKENTTNQILQNAANTIPSKKPIALNAYIF